VANTRYDSGWTLGEAQALLSGIAPGLLMKGFAVGLTGSVLTKGQSEHDLDIVLYPMQFTVATNWEVAREALTNAGFECLLPVDTVHASWRRKGFLDEKFVEVWLFNKRRVDVFFLR
jgi:predicted nucleotidyltransferase